MVDCLYHGRCRILDGRIFGLRMPFAQSRFTICSNLIRLLILGGGSGEPTTVVIRADPWHS